MTGRFKKYLKKNRDYIDPELLRWERKYPRFPGVAECVRLICSGMAHGVWADIIGAELVEHAAECLDELIAAYRDAPDSHLRFYVLMALEIALVPESVPFLVDVLRAEGQRDAEYARRTLAAIGAREARVARFSMSNDDFRIDIGCSSTGDFMRMVHLPTGIERVHHGSLFGVDRNEVKRRWRAAIEVEIREVRPRKSKS